MHKSAITLLTIISISLFINSSFGFIGGDLHISNDDYEINPNLINSDIMQIPEENFQMTESYKRYLIFGNSVFHNSQSFIHNIYSINSDSGFLNVATIN